MGRTTRIILLVAASVLLVIMLLFLALWCMVMLSDNAGHLQQYQKQYGGTSTEIRTDLREGALYVYYSGGDQIQVTYQDDASASKFTVSEQDGVLTIVRNERGWWERLRDWVQFSNQSEELEIGLPDDFSGRMELHSESGAMDLESLSCAEVTATVNSGSIKLRQVLTTGSCSVETGSGSIQALSCRTGTDFALQTSSGSITCSDLEISGQTRLTTSSGSIRVENSAFDSLQMTASSGSVRGGSITAMTFSAQSSSGGVSFDSIQASGIVAHTSSGSVHMTRMDASTIRLDAGSGSVYGSVCDSRSEYSISSSSGSGSNHLEPNLRGGGKTLEVSTGSGSISFDFDAL